MNSGTSDGVPPSVSITLLGGLRQGDQQAWWRLERLFGPIVREWCRRGGLQPQDADDIAQEVFEALAIHLARFRKEYPGDSFRRWLWSITQNKMRDHWRRQKRQPLAPGGTWFHQKLDNLPEQQPPSTSVDEEIGLFRRALGLIQTDFEWRTWQAFWRVVIDGVPVAEVAAARGMSVGAVYVAKSRVQRRLREEFGGLLG